MSRKQRTEWTFPCNEGRKLGNNTTIRWARREGASTELKNMQKSTRNIDKRQWSPQTLYNGDVNNTFLSSTSCYITSFSKSHLRNISVRIHFPRNFKPSTLSQSPARKEEKKKQRNDQENFRNKSATSNIPPIPSSAAPKQIPRLKRHLLLVQLRNKAPPVTKITCPRSYSNLKLLNGASLLH